MAQSPISISSYVWFCCVFFFATCTFESHVIYGLHFHAYMKTHVVATAAASVARASATTSKNYYAHFPHAFPATPRYQSVSSHTVSNGNNFTSIKLHRCCKMWLVRVYVDACADNEFWGGNSLTLPLANHE